MPTGIPEAGGSGTLALRYLTAVSPIMNSKHPPTEGQTMDVQSTEALRLRFVTAVQRAGKHHELYGRACHAQGAMSTAAIAAERRATNADIEVIWLFGSLINGVTV